MTVGEKIKKYRQLKGMTKRELGVAVGFKESTADVRINQYESDRMVPRGDSVKETTRAAPDQKGIQNQAPPKQSISGAQKIKWSLLTDL